jgi:hypothetical protein
MNRPPFEVADIIRAHGNSFVEKGRSWVTWLHLRVLFAIEHCGARRPSGPLPPMRPRSHLLQLLPLQALSQVPN